MIDQYLIHQILKERGDNRSLVDELDKLSETSKQKLYAIFQEKEHKIRNLENKLRNTRNGFISY